MFSLDLFHFIFPMSSWLFFKGSTNSFGMILHYLIVVLLQFELALHGMIDCSDQKCSFVTEEYFSVLVSINLLVISVARVMEISLFVQFLY